MARYADSLLTDGERIAVRSRQHWLATIIDARNPWLIFIAAIVLLLLSQGITGPLRDVLGVVVLAALVVSIAWLIRVYWNWLAEDYIVTNRRVLKVEGIINKRSADSSLEKINDAMLEQNLFGRLLNYGDLDIVTASESAIDRFRMLDRAPAFKREMLHQKHELEGEFSRPMPAPPLRAPAAGAGAALAGSVSAGHLAPSTPPSGPGAMSADDVTRALSNLADLRDRGAISPQEYDDKKAELLARL